MPDHTIIFATVVLKSKTDNSFLQKKDLHSGNVGATAASTATMQKAIEALTKLGFTIQVSNNLMLSVSAPQSVFETVFKMELEEKKSDNTLFYKARKKVIPASLKNLVQDIVFAEPMELF